MRASGRKLVVDSVEYAWTSKHGHPAGDSPCQETLTAWEVGRENAPMVVRFVNGRGCVTTAGQGWGGGLGLVLVTTNDLVNLNRPAVAAALIRAALRAGWNPGRGKPYVIEDGAGFVAEYPVPLGE
jgi:hypothetical protein